MDRGRYQPAITGGPDPEGVILDEHDPDRQGERSARGGRSMSHHSADGSLVWGRADTCRHKGITDDSRRNGWAATPLGSMAD